jgi:lambda family phage minor tail protein L
MGQGQDKIASSLMDLQPTAIVELFQLYFNPIDKPDAAIYFHGGTIFQKSIKWQNQEYMPLPVESEGFEVTANGQLPRPKIRISNKDYYMTQLLLNNSDFQFGKLIRKRTFVKYLDDYNFDGGNPWGQTDSSAELSNDTFVIGQKTAENKMFVEFELTSPLDLENFEVNARLLMSRYCSWYYRGNGCNYAGPPLETEYGQAIQMNETSRSNWAALSQNAEWATGISYTSGTPVYLKNSKILIHPSPLDEAKQGVIEPAKIWYVAQADHTSTFLTQPDNNETYWLRDGCNKKLNGCKKRFQSSESQILPSNPYSVSNYFVDLSHKQIYNTNNIASQATVTGSSVAAGSSFRNAVDGLTGTAGGKNKTLDTGIAWVSVGPDDPWIRLTWDAPKIINRIDIYDRYGISNVDFKTANIKYYSGASLLASENITINNDGSRTTTGFANKTVTKIEISGSGSDINAGLAEIAVFEPSGLGLYNDSFKNSGIYAAENLHIATWLQFPSGVPRSDQLLNIFHNVKTNNQYSGINLYVSGNDKIALDFATVLVSGEPASYIVTPRTITMPWDATSLKALHLEVYGGKTSGTSVVNFPNGEIKLSDEDNLESRYTLALPNTGQKISGEFFLFKNPSYTGGMTDLFFAVNNWQFSTGNLATPIPSNSTITSNLQLTSSLQLGSTAIWTGKSGIEYRKKFFNRDGSNVWNESEEKAAPRNYAELTGDSPILKTGLFAWWDMNLDDSPVYKIDASNDANQKIYLSGEYTGSIEYFDSQSFISKQSSIPQTPKNYLPFGGFPGTDRYGR